MVNSLEPISGRIQSEVKCLCNLPSGKGIFNSSIWDTGRFDRSNEWVISIYWNLISRHISDCHHVGLIEPIVGCLLFELGVVLVQREHIVRLVISG